MRKYLVISLISLIIIPEQISSTKLRTHLLGDRNSMFQVIHSFKTASLFVKRHFNKDPMPHTSLYHSQQLAKLHEHLRNVIRYLLNIVSNKRIKVFSKQVQENTKNMQTCF